MSHKQVALDLARFLDDLAPGAAGGADRDTVRTLAETYLQVCYEDLGKKPRLLEGDEMATALTTFLPARLAPHDGRVDHLEAVVLAFLDHLETTEVVPRSYEIRRAFAEGIDALVARVRTGDNASEQLAVARDPFVHGAPKLGRNDPCSCGSGKKFKKCHGRGL